MGFYVNTDVEAYVEDDDIIEYISKNMEIDEVFSEEQIEKYYNENTDPFNIDDIIEKIRYFPLENMEKIKNECEYFLNHYKKGK